MLNTRKGIFQLCIISAMCFIASAIPVTLLDPTNSVLRISVVLFGLFMFVLGLTLDNKFEIDELRMKLVNTSSKEESSK